MPVSQRSLFDIHPDELATDFVWENGRQVLLTVERNRALELRRYVPFWLRSLGWYLFEVFDYPHPAWKMEMPGMTPWTTHHWREIADAIHEAGAIQWRSGCVPDEIVNKVWDDKELAAQWKTQWVIGLSGDLPLNYKKTLGNTMHYLEAKRRWDLARARNAEGVKA